MVDAYIWPFTVLIIFGGMLAVVWRSLSIAHDLAKIVLQGGGTLPPIKPTIPVPTLAVAVPTPTKPSAPTPTLPLTIDDEPFIEFVKRQEGFVAKARWDYKQWTNGYGTRATGPDEVITEAEADKRLRGEITTAIAAMKKFIPLAPIGVQQAMVDAVFNLGEAWEHQTLGELLQKGDYAGAKAHLMQYVHAGNPPVVLDALVKRRTAECAMFDHPL